MSSGHNERENGASSIGQSAISPATRSTAATGSSSGGSRFKSGAPFSPNWATCSVEGCTKPSKRRTSALCSMHKERLRSNGTTDVAPKFTRDGRTRFMAYVEKTESCWLWQGKLTYDGYGLFKNLGYRTGAHRHSYLFFVGPISEGLEVDHLCRVRNCVNPEHLELVTPEENNRRAMAASYGNTCPLGHPIRRQPNGSRYCPTCRHDRYVASRRSA